MLAITVNSHAQTVNPGTSVQDLLHHAGHQGKRLAVELNGAIVPRSLHGSTLLQQGDMLEIVIAVGGG